jgi:hypothetical protein
VDLAPILGLIFTLVMTGLVVFFFTAGRDRFGRNFREIPAFTKLRQAVGIAVEAGTRLHISVGRGGITGPESAPAFAGMTMLDRVARAASVSDRPPVATSGDGALTILTQDTLRGSYRALGVESHYDPTSGRVVGLTPFSYAAGALPVVYDEQIAANLLNGHFEGEVGLINEAAERKGSLVIAGSESITGQAVIYATASDPLIGEEAFTGGAYLGAGPMHDASLHAQDVMRWVLIVLILAGSVIKLFGLDQFLVGLFSGILK